MLSRLSWSRADGGIIIFPPFSTSDLSLGPASMDTEKQRYCVEKRFWKTRGIGAKLCKLSQGPGVGVASGSPGSPSLAQIADGVLLQAPATHVQAHCHPQKVLSLCYRRSKCQSNRKPGSRPSSTCDLLCVSRDSTSSLGFSCLNLKMNLLSHRIQ